MREQLGVKSGNKMATETKRESISEVLKGDVVSMSLIQMD